MTLLVHRTLCTSTSNQRSSITASQAAYNLDLSDGHSVAHRNYWKDIKNQRKFLEKLGAQLKIRTLDDWNQIKIKDVIDNGGSGLLSHYGGSLQKALKFIYPEHVFKFPQKATPRYWDKMD